MVQPHHARGRTASFQVILLRCRLGSQQHRLQIEERVSLAIPGVAISPQEAANWMSQQQSCPLYNHQRAMPHDQAILDALESASERVGAMLLLNSIAISASQPAEPKPVIRQ